MKIVNPYNGIDFSTVQYVNSVSHEHILTDVNFKRAYDRGIRHFGLVHYGPAVPRYPFSNFYYKENGTPYKYTDFVDDSHEDQSLNDYSLTEKEYIDHSYPSFIDAEGNTIYTDDVPQVPNNEHPQFTIEIGVTTGFLQHFNVLGNLWPEPGVGTSGVRGSRNGHPIYDFTDIQQRFLNVGNQLWANKIFGTINHCYDADRAISYIRRVPQVFLGMEAFNNGYSDEVNQSFLDAYDKVLKSGLKIWLTAVVDWQGNGGNVDYDRGCNVLLVPSNYNSLPANDFTVINNKSYVKQHSSTYTKAECGLDCYIAGKFFGSGFGNHRITALDVIERKITFSCDNGNGTTTKAPTYIAAITNKGVTVGSGNSISVDIKSGISFVHFHAKYDNDDYKDFILTQPIFIDDNLENMPQKAFALGVI